MNFVNLHIRPYLAKYISVKFAADNQNFVKITDENLQNFICSFLEKNPSIENRQSSIVNRNLSIENSFCPFSKPNLTLILPENITKNYISPQNQKRIAKRFYLMYINELTDEINKRKSDNPKISLNTIFYDFVEKYQIGQFIDCETFRKQYIRKIKYEKANNL